MKKILILPIFFLLLAASLSAAVSFDQFLVDGNSYSVKVGTTNPTIRLDVTVSSGEEIASTWTYRTSTNSGVVWSSWNVMNDYDVLFHNSEHTAATIIYSTTTFNFPSSLTANKIEISVKLADSLIEYTTQYIIKVDTIPPANVTSMVDAVSVESKKIKVNWTEPADEPGNQPIIGYKFCYSTDNVNFVSVNSQVIAAAIGGKSTATITVPLPETTYYVLVKTNDGLQDSTGQTITALSGGLKAPTNFKGVAKSTGSITWSWTDNSAKETGYGIYTSGNNLLVTLTANTTFFLETSLGEATEYSRHIKAINGSITSDVVYATAATLSTYNFDIDDDGIIESFSPPNTFVDFNGGTSFVSYINDDRVFFTRDTSIWVWILASNTLAKTTAIDINGDGASDLLYTIDGKRRYFDGNYDRDIGTVSGTILDQYQNKLANVSFTLITSSETLNLITDTNGAFSTPLPITLGVESKIIINKDGYSPYEETQMLYNGSDNSWNILLKNYVLDIGKDDIHNYPNPFAKSSGTKIVFNVKDASKVEILVYDVKGKMVQKLLDGDEASGSHELDWNGGGLPKGIYYMFYKTASSKIMKKVVIK